MVCTYLVHHGYLDSAEAFASSTGQVFQEDYSSIKNRQSRCCSASLPLFSRELEKQRWRKIFKLSKSCINFKIWSKSGNFMITSVYLSPLHFIVTLYISMMIRRDYKAGIVRSRGRGDRSDQSVIPRSA